MRGRRLAAAALLVTLGLAVRGWVAHTGFEPQPISDSPRVGFSYSPHAVVGQDPVAGLRTLLDRLQPDVVRLPIYWPDVAPEPSRLDFSTVDSLVAAVAAHNRSARKHQARLVLVVGIRNLGFPEVWVPDWVQRTQSTDLSELADTPAYLAYLQAAITRYAASGLLLAWQVENEPFDDVTSGRRGSVALSAEAIDQQIRIVRQLDGEHPIVVTTYNSATLALDRAAASRWSWIYHLLPAPQPAGHPDLALGTADVLGLDAYVVTPSTPLEEASAGERIGWKTAALAYWAEEAEKRDKQMWIMEMQAAPWAGVSGFTPEELLHSARLYRQAGAGVVLLWGVESWLQDPAWMLAGRHAVWALRPPSAR